MTDFIDATTVRHSKSYYCNNMPKSVIPPAKGDKNNLIQELTKSSNEYKARNKFEGNLYCP